MHPKIKKLRDKENLRLFDSKERLFIQLQINKKEKGFICWQKYVSKDRRNWIKHNDYLSLRDCWNILEKVKSKKGIYSL